MECDKRGRDCWIEEHKKTCKKCQKGLTCDTWKQKLKVKPGHKCIDDRQVVWDFLEIKSRLCVVMLHKKWVRVVLSRLRNKDDRGRGGRVLVLVIGIIDKTILVEHTLIFISSFEASVHVVGKVCTHVRACAQSILIEY